MVYQSPLKADVFVTIGISETVNPNENFLGKTFPNGIMICFKILLIMAPSYNIKFNIYNGIFYFVYWKEFNLTF